ncbi:uncharacterized protein LOC142339918 [Convolutriloba macropyga]|uniref:uncharacterized protein LOC142339918 n=1 Tax=Convolutriloba macropyga TaxID=536237 RepID=UPI003F524D94
MEYHLICLVTLIVLGPQVVFSGNDHYTHHRGRSSLDFIIPNNFKKQSRQCQRFSSYFCLHRYFIAVENSGNKTTREALDSDMAKFRRVIRDYYKYYNIFSFIEIDSDTAGCCGYQVMTYMKHGQFKGLSPSEYFQRLTDFSTEGKRLIFLQSIFIPEMCLNVITHLSFGQGLFRMNGGRYRQPMGIFIQQDQKWHIFHHYHLTKLITFEWFKNNVICAGQPWICNQTANYRER